MSSDVYASYFVICHYHHLWLSFHLSFLPLLISLFSPSSSVSVYFLGFCPFHFGLWIAVFVCLGFCSSLLVCVTLQISFPLLADVWLSSMFLWSPSSLNWLLYRSLTLFLWISITLFLWKANFFLNFCMDSHLSWVFLILSLSISSLWAATTTPFSENLKEYFHSLSWLLTSVLHTLFHIHIYVIHSCKNNYL